MYRPSVYFDSLWNVFLTYILIELSLSEVKVKLIFHLNHNIDVSKAYIKNNTKAAVFSNIL